MSIKFVLSRLLLISSILTFSIGAFSQGFLDVDGQDIIDQDGNPYLLKGMGLGGWMLQEGYMLQTSGFANAQHQIRAKITDVIGEEATQTFYDQWLQNHCTRADIDSLASWGFNSVRLPMHYNLFTLPIEDEPIPGQQTWLEKGFTLTDSLISWCKANDMFVVLDLHAAPGGQGSDEAISDYDPSKPSLFESTENQDKMVALWGRIAERYADEPTVGGYDILNEPNWPVSGSNLRALYVDVTQAIRAVDNNHIIFIEGNWWANDFTGLTPPWDDKLVYSPHKYWSINDQASIQWVLDIREAYDVPLYLGESGENSNVWFRDAIKLFEDNNMGWAWWPMKKIESVAGPLSITKSDGYQDLLNYWGGTGVKPSVEVATTTLMQLTDDLKIENCRYQSDVIDAMFRQVESNDARPFKIHHVPGIIYASDYDYGTNGVAYSDNDAANYSVSTGTYTAWNNGWAYRNDGVDIEVCNDIINANGYNVGWIETDEWMQYSTDVQEDGLYQAHLRIASGSGNGQISFGDQNGPTTPNLSLPNTQGWTNWESYTIEDIVLTTNDTKFRVYAGNEGFNLSSIELVKTGELSEITSTYVNAITLDESTIQVTTNKPLDADSEISLDDYNLTVNGQPISIGDVSIIPNTRHLLVKPNITLSASHVIRVSYNGQGLKSIDGLQVEVFNQELVTNTLEEFITIPGRLEAEDYDSQSGVQLETANDDGGGQNIAHLDTGDYLDYTVRVTTAGDFLVEYRHAALSETGAVDLLLKEGDQFTLLNTTSLPSTGGWQTWSTTESMVTLPTGIIELRIRIRLPQFNLNYLDFSLITSHTEDQINNPIAIYPNPVLDILRIDSNLDIKSVTIVDLSGRIVQPTIRDGLSKINVARLNPGLYLLKVVTADNEVLIERFVKQ